MVLLRRVRSEMFFRRAFQQFHNHRNPTDRKRTIDLLPNQIVPFTADHAMDSLAPTSVLRHGLALCTMKQKIVIGPMS